MNGVCTFPWLIGLYILNSMSPEFIALNYFFLKANAQQIAEQNVSCQWNGLNSCDTSASCFSDLWCTVWVCPNLYIHIMFPSLILTFIVFRAPNLIYKLCYYEEWLAQNVNLLVRGTSSNWDIYTAHAFAQCWHARDLSECLVYFCAKTMSSSRAVEEEVMDKDQILLEKDAEVSHKHICISFWQSVQTTSLYIKIL